MARKGPSTGNAPELLSVGIDHFLNGRQTEAEDVFQKVLAIDPGNEDAREYLDSLREFPSKPPATGWDSSPPVEQNAPPANRPAIEPLPSRPGARSPPSVAPPARSAAQSLLKEARAAAELGDYTGAVELCDRILAREPAFSEAIRLRDQAAATLVQMYESQLGGPAGIPEVIVDPGEIIWLSLDSRAGFVLSQIDGQVSYDDLYAICGMTKLDTARILAQLVEQKVIRSRLLGARR